MIYFTSDRLIFRDWSEDDLIGFRKMNQDKEVMEYFSKVLTEEESNIFARKIQEELTECHYGLFAVETKDEHIFIGFIGFHKATFEAFFTPCIEIGWRLNKTYWFQGYATEGAKACLVYAKNRFNFNEVYSFTAKINKRSENVMKKIQMEKVAEFQYPKIDKDNPLSEHVLYRINL